MRLVCVWSLVLILAALGQPNALGATTGSPALRITEKSYDRPNSLLSIRLENNSEVAITAWRLSLIRRDFRGRYLTMNFDRDYSTNGEERSDAERTLEPGHSIHLDFSVHFSESGETDPAFALRVSCVVFSDARWEGREDCVGEIFASRKARADLLEETALFVESLALRGEDQAGDTSVIERLRRRASELSAPWGTDETRAVWPEKVSADLSAERRDLGRRLAVAGLKIEHMPGEEVSVLTRLHGELQAEYHRTLSGIDRREEPGS